MEFDLTYEQLYGMTISELIKTLENRKRGLGYRMWRQANLIGASIGKGFPKSPEKGSPELYPRPKTIPMPSGLLGKIGGNNV